MVLGEFGPTSTDDTYYPLGLDIIGQQQDDVWSYFGYDGLGSVRQVYDSLGAVGYATSYAPYGTAFESTGGLTTSLGFTGEYTDPTGLLYLRARYYNPGIGTFLTKDPAEGFLGGESIRWNAYNYVGANPINTTDPSGEFINILLGIGLGAVIGGGFAALHAIATFELAKSGACGCEAEQWAKNTNRNAFILNAVLHGAFYGAVLGGLAGCGGVGLGAASLIGGGSAALSGADALRRIFDALQQGDKVSACDILNFVIGVAGTALGIAGVRAGYAKYITAPYTKGQLSKGGQVPDKNQHTKAGFSLQKHGREPGPSRLRVGDWDTLTRSVTGKSVPTTASGRNVAGQAVLDYIIRNPWTRWGRGYSRTLAVPTIEGRLPNGLGARWNANTGDFIGFID